MTHNRRRLRRYVFAWVLLGLVVGCTALVLDPVAPPSPILAVVLGGAGALAGLPQARLRLGPGDQEATNVIELVAVPTMLLLGPRWAVVVVGVAVLVAELVQPTRSAMKTSFNVGSKVTATGLGAVGYLALAGPGFAADTSALGAALVAAGSFVAVNSLAFSGVVARAASRPWRSTAREELASGLPLDAGIAASGVLAAVLLVHAPVALPLLAAPALMDRLRARARKEAHDLAAARDRAEAANQAKDVFLSQMSHELRTPLNAILGFGQLLEIDEALPPDAREQASHIVRSGRHLLGLIDEVLDISQIEAGHISIALERLLVRDIVAESLEVVAPLAEQHHVHLRVRADAGSVLADRRRLRQVLLNLLSNAIKYNRAEGEVTVEAHPEDGTVRIDVTDTGPGIAPADLDRLFVPFDRLHAEFSGIPGTGLGLAIARQLVEAMGGALRVSSVVGRGSTFSVVLPEAPPDPAMPSTGSPTT